MWQSRLELCYNFAFGPSGYRRLEVRPGKPRNEDDVPFKGKNERRTSGPGVECTQPPREPTVTHAQASFAV
jgi:hypothetical protein